MGEQKKILTSILILAVLHFVQFSGAKRDCQKMKSSFSNTCASFLDCAIGNSEPVTYCRHCGDWFSNATLKYNELVGDETCKAKFFDQDRLNILEQVYLNAQSLWDSGSCSNCYDWVNPPLNTTKQKESNITTEFFHNLDSFNVCIDSSFNSTTACSDCMTDYNNVNNKYNEIKQITKDNICFDIKDAMNKTRLNWSHNLKCCKDRHTSLTAFIVAASMISGLIPFGFYTSAMFFGWRREQLHEALIDSEIQPYARTPIIQFVEEEQPSAIPSTTNLLDLET